MTNTSYYYYSIRVVNNEYKENNEMNKYLVALPSFPNSKGFNHPTILVKAKSVEEAKEIVRHLKPKNNIGDIKKVDY